MANSDKNILITPSVGLSTNPTIKFTGANNTPTTLRVLDDGTVSFEATAGQLFSISDGLTGSIFSVNDISGIPSIEVLDTGLVKLNQYGGSTVFGTSTAIQNSSSVNAKVSISTASATTPGLIIKGASSQSANLQEWQDSTGVLLGRIAYTGQMLLPSYVGNNFQITAAGAMTVGTSSAQSNIQALILSTVSTNVGLVVKGATSQTANLTEWQNSSGTVLASISSIGAITTNSNIVQASSGRTFIGGSGDYSAFLNVSIPSAGRQGIVIRANASQSANLQEWQNSSGTVLSKINNDGALIIDTANTTSSGLIVKGVTGQTANVVEFWQNPTTIGFQIQQGTYPVFINNLTVGSNVYSNYQIVGGAISGNIGNVLHQFNSWNASWTTLGIRGAASQTGNLQEWQNSSGTVVARIGATGATLLSASNYQSTYPTVTIGDTAYGFSAEGAYLRYYTSVTSNGGHAWYGSSDNSVLRMLLSNNGTLVLRGIASQTANLQELQNSIGTVLSSFSSAGRLAINTASNAGGRALYVVQPNGGYGAVFDGAGTVQTVSIYAASGAIPLLIAGAIGQTADLTQWQNSSGTTVARFDAYGTFESGTANNYGSWINVQPVLTSDRGIVIRGAVSQTANLQEWQDSGGTILSSISSNGNLVSNLSGTSSTFPIFVYTTSSLTTPYGIAVARQNRSDQYIHIHESDGSKAVIEAVAPNAAKPFFIKNKSNEALYLGTNDTNRFSITSTGLIGVGTDTPSSAQMTLINSNSANIGLLVKGAASQTANLQEWQSSAGTVIAKLSSSGSFSAYNNNYFARTHFLQDGTTDASPQFTGAYFTASSSNSAIYARPISASITPLVIQGVASQTADLQQWQTNSGDVLATMTAGGTLVIGTSSSSASGIKVGSVSFGGISYNGISNPAGATTVPSLVIKGISSQTADLQQWHNSSGTVLAKVFSTGYIYSQGFQVPVNTNALFDSSNLSGTISLNSGGVTIEPRLTTNVSLIVKGVTSQTANLQEWQNSSGTVLTKVDSSGGIDFVQGGYVRSYYFAKAGSNNVMLTLTGDDNIQLGNGNMSGRSGANNIFIANATTVPSSNPSGGGVLYVENGALKYRGSSGTVTTIANA